MNLPAIFNAYERKARLYPAFLAILPIVGTAVLAFHDALSVFQSLAAILVAAGGAFLCAELARDGGKQIEPSLIERWGGLQSATIFRHSDPRLDAITKARYHARLASLVSGAPGPTAEQEATDPKMADTIYLAWSNYVRTHTLDQKKYFLLFQENVSYGFRRNVLGLRPYALVLSGVCLLASATMLYAKPQVDLANWTALALNVGVLAFWGVVVRPDWVKLPALGYAQQLAEAVDVLANNGGGDSPARKRGSKGKVNAGQGN